MKKARILIVEDEQIIALNLKNILERYDYHVLEIASTREEAVAKRGEHLLALQKLRSEKQAEENVEAIREAGEYLVESYLNNIWPKMNVTWGTYTGPI